MKSTRLAIFLQSGSPETIRTAASILASAAALNWETTAIFMGEALRKLVEARLDEGLTSDDAGAAGLIQSARAFGGISILACTADAQSTGYSRDVILKHVDDILGMPTILLRIEGAATKLFI